MAAINTLIFSSIMMATAVSPLYENLLGEEIIFKRLDSTSISLPPQAVRYEQTINLVYANPEQATVSVYTEQGILIDLTSVSAFGQVDIDTSDWARGTYYIQVQSASAAYQGVFNYVPDNERAPSN
ncbi:MAG: T9SS type A sorting domain-containing protein [Muribaculaceae bacterium]|nr:T9SS type A sorting domain-containing protein [Muribaculaceae bacterium]